MNELGRNLRYLLGFNPEGNDAKTKLQNFLEAQLRSATHMFCDPAGFGRFVKDRSTPRHEKAKLVISCQQGLNFYCDLAGEEYGLPSFNGRVLVLRYTLDRLNHTLSGLVDKRASVEFPSTAFRLVPSDNAHTVSGDPTDLARDGTGCGNWRELLRVLVDPRVPIPLQAVYDALQFVTEIELQERLLMHFPVKVQKSVDSGHFCRIVLDTERFNWKSDRDPYKSLLFLDARMKAETFFQVKILEWLEKQNNAQEARISFRKKGTDINVSLPIQPNDVRPGFILICPTLRDLEGEGELRFADDQGIQSLYAARQAALVRLRYNSDVLAQLDSPHPTMALSRTRPEKFG
ncbi:hypothetical protein [Breoghania sp.]|uniref:hypothetical protein n=1 Tax=Breoghania sp. TaxID=2065378 RepID=UPI00261619FF|nr:hypothetical protein [Breoghania sp.]MDJ0933376.1 hypothetical protein [Breoghania sp.]